MLVSTVSLLFCWPMSTTINRNIVITVIVETCYLLCIYSSYPFPVCFEFTILHLIYCVVYDLYDLYVGPTVTCIVSSTCVRHVKYSCNLDLLDTRSNPDLTLISPSALSLTDVLYIQHHV